METKTDNIYLGDAARQGIMNGITKVASAVKITLGAKGQNGALQESVYPFHIITNDGISIAKKIKLTDPVEIVGMNLVTEAMEKANKEGGDGSTTTCTLTEAIAIEGLKTGISGMEIKRSLDALLPLIEQEIDAQKQEITVDEVGSVATISAESEDMGKILQEIYQEIGKDGIIELDASKSFDTYYEIKEGVRFKGAGYISPYMANERKSAVYKKPSILVTKQKIAAISDIDPLIQQMMKEGNKELVIFCDDIDQSVVGACVALHITGQFKVLIIKAPTIWKDMLFADFAKVTGATVVEPSTGVTFKTLQLQHLGTCGKIITTKDETTVLGIADISDHIATLQEQGDEEAQLRLSWLTTKAAILKLGANSESELSYVRLKAEDAINASRLALEDGVVAGGGLALLNVAFKMPDTLGGRILNSALRYPINQIITNAGKNPSSFLIGDRDGFNAETGEVVDMWDAKILDPAKVVKNAVKYAISVVGTALTIGVVVTIPEDLNKKEGLMPQMPFMG